MPMRLNEPTRPRRLWSPSPECRRYTSGPGIVFIPFGLLFSMVGVYIFSACVWSVSERFGIPAGDAGDGWSIADELLRALGLLAFGSGFVIAGSMMLWTLRTTLDRDRDLVIVRSGWFGLKCRQRRLSEFRSVAVLPSRNRLAADGKDSFDIALLDASGAIVIGHVSRSHDLALNVADEISEFTMLPVTTPRTAAAASRHVPTGVP